jgi:hypothetical protein
MVGVDMAYKERREEIALAQPPQHHMSLISTSSSHAELAHAATLLVGINSFTHALL